MIKNMKSKLVCICKKCHPFFQHSVVLLFCISLISGCGGSSVKSDNNKSSDSYSDQSSDQIQVSDGSDTSEDAVSEQKIEPIKREASADLQAELAKAYRSQNDEAISRVAVQILSQNPNDEKALNSLGLYHYRKGRFLAAKYFFERALKTNPNSSAALCNLGLASLALGEQLDAIRFFKKSMELNPRDGIAAANLGSIYVQEKDFTKAQIALETAVKNGMRETRTLTNYGIALTANGQYESARSALDEALKANSNNKEALFAKAILLIDQMKQYSEGIEALDRLKFLGPAAEMRNRMNTLENTAKTGIK